jgi:hypothetical protein
MVALVPPEFFFSTSIEPEPDPPGWVDGAPTGPTGHSCTVCGTRDVVWVHPLDGDKSRFQLWGKRHTLPPYWALCDRCEGLYQAGDQEALVELKRAGRHEYSHVDEEVRTTLAAFGVADRGARRVADPPAEVVRLLEQGFEPLYGYTGAVEEVWGVWPVDMRVELPPQVEPDEERRLFVRSPWPSVSVPQLIGLLGPWVWPWGWGADKTEPSPDDAREALIWSEDRGLARLASRHTARGETFD